MSASPNARPRALRGLVLTLSGLLVLLSGCTSDVGRTEDVGSLHPQTNTATAGTVDLGSAKAHVVVGVGSPNALDEVKDKVAHTCDALGGLRGAVVIPLSLSVLLDDDVAGNLSMSLEAYSVDGSGGVRSLLGSIAWVVQYSGAPPTCKSGAGTPAGLVTGGGRKHNWNAYLLLLTGGVESAKSIVVQPGVAAGALPGTFIPDAPPSTSAVACYPPDPAAGRFAYVAVDGATALEHGCQAYVQPDDPSASTDQEAGAARICIAQYPAAASHPSAGGGLTYNLQGSLEQVCEGFGAPELAITPPMACALIAAAADYNDLADTADTLCDTEDIINTYRDGTWLPYVADKACEYIGLALSYGSAIVAAGATVETGPGAAAVGLATWQALRTSTKLVCGGLSDSGAYKLGQQLEATHENHVAMDILHEGLCLHQDDDAALKHFSAVPC